MIIVEENIFIVIVYKYFSTEEILKCHMKDCFNINGIRRIIMSKKDEYVNFKNYFLKNKVVICDFCRF